MFIIVSKTWDVCGQTSIQYGFICGSSCREMLTSQTWYAMTIKSFPEHKRLVGKNVSQVRAQGWPTNEGNTTSGK